MFVIWSSRVHGKCIWTTDVMNTGDTLADTMETRKPKDLRLDANKKPGMVLFGFCVGCI